jgi:quinol monooxygenase YgiN
MFGILFRAEVRPEEREDFINFFKWNIRVAKEREPGTLRFDLYQDPEAENAFFVYEAYRNKEAFEDHKKNKPYKIWDSDIRLRMLEKPYKVWFKRDAVCSLAMTIDADHTYRAKGGRAPAGLRGVETIAPRRYFESLPAYLRLEGAFERELDRAGRHLESAEAVCDSYST